MEVTMKESRILTERINLLENLRETINTFLREEGKERQELDLVAKNGSSEDVRMLALEISPGILNEALDEAQDRLAEMNILVSKARPFRFAIRK